MKISKHCSTKSEKYGDYTPLKDGRGIVKTKEHLLKGISAKRACECSIFLVL